MPFVSLKLKEVLKLHAGLQSVGKRDLPLALSFKLAKMAKQFTDTVTAFTETQQHSLLKCGAENTFTGVRLLEPTRRQDESEEAFSERYAATKAMFDKYQEDLKVLLESECSYFIEICDIAEFGTDIQIKPVELEAILPILIQSQS